MATVDDVEVANASFPNVRQDLNDILEAITTNFSADNEPTTTYPNQWWYETDTNQLYIRNEDDDAWIHVLTLDQTTDTVASVEGVSSDKIEEGNSSVEVVDTGTGFVQFNVDGAEVARMNSAGLEITSGNITFGTGDRVIGNGDEKIKFDSTNEDIEFQTSDTARMILDASGNVTVKSSGGTTPTYDYSTLGEGLHFRYWDQSGARHADIVATGNTPAGATQDLRFFTNSGGSPGTASERMRIDSSGNLLVGVSSVPTGTTDGVVIQPASAGQILSSRNSTGGVTHVDFKNPNGTVGFISTSGSSTTYSTSSDYRLKEDWVPMEQSIERVKALNPVNFAWKVDGTRIDGFLAHEAQEVVPEAVTGTKDAVIAYGIITDAEGSIVQENVVEPETLEEGQTWTKVEDKPDYQGIDQAKLVPLLTAALQDAIAKIEALEARVEALES